VYRPGRPDGGAGLIRNSPELAEIASISRGFDAGNPGAAAGRLSSPVLASA
jgi:hypothetical protein